MDAQDRTRAMIDAAMSAVEKLQKELAADPAASDAKGCADAAFAQLEETEYHYGMMLSARDEAAIEDAPAGRAAELAAELAADKAERFEAGVVEAHERIAFPATGTPAATAVSITDKCGACGAEVHELATFDPPVCKTCVELPSRTPAQIDVEIAKLDEQAAKAAHRIAQANETLKHRTDSVRDRRYADLALAELTEQHQKLDAARAALAPLEAEYRRRGGWARFFIVKNNNGHVHAHRHCSTCFPTTQYGWLPALSGASEETAVAEYGEMMCTVCFPSAPTLLTRIGKSAYAKRQEEAAAAKAAKTAAKAAALAAKSITALDGSPLVVRGETIRTVYRAKERLTSEAYYAALLQKPSCTAPDRETKLAENLANVEKLATALAAKSLAEERAVDLTGDIRAARAADIIVRAMKRAVKEVR